MRIRFSIFSPFFLVLAAAGAAAAQDVSYVPGRLLVQFRPDVRSEQANSVLNGLGARETGTIGKTGVKVLSLAAGASEAAVMRAFQQRPEVLFAELDRKVKPSAVTPNDPWYTYYGSHLKRISAPTAWSTTTGSRLIIAILDTGVDGKHEDLAEKMVPGWNTYSNSSDTSDVFGHGTQVAGVAAAVTNNGIGVSGVCWACWIMPVRISDGSGTATYSSAANAIAWAGSHGARIANLSYAMTGSSTVSAAAKEFTSNGGVLSVSSGNNGTNDASQDNPYILTIGATDSSNVVYSWSNTGNNLDLVAPGCVGATVRMAGGYTSACGTSFSAPIVAGVAALVLSANPGLTSSGVSSALRSSADDLGAAGWDASYGWGQINAAKAVAIATGGATQPPADTQPPAVSVASPLSGSTVSGVVNVLASSTDNIAVTKVEFYLDGSLQATLTAAPYTWTFATTGVTNGDHLVSVKAHDAARNAATATANVSVSNPVDSQPPTISLSAPIAGSTVSITTPISASASDNVGIKSVQFFVDGVSIGTATTAPFTVNWNTKKLTKGAHSLSGRAIDLAGNATTSSPISVYK